jgi:four helix bundle protein
MQYQNSFRQLIVWQKAKELTLFVYKITKKFPTEERFGLCSQMKRAAGSVLWNIAEGNAKITRNDRCHFFNISQCSLVELDCQSELAFCLKYINNNDYPTLLELINKTGFLLIKLINSQN